MLYEFNVDKNIQIWKKKLYNNFKNSDNKIDFNKKQ